MGEVVHPWAVQPMRSTDGAVEQQRTEPPELLQRNESLVSKPLFRVFNVCGGVGIPLPEHYNGWKIDTIDVDEGHGNTYHGDIEHIITGKAEDPVPGGLYDAAYFSHAIEHFHSPFTLPLLMWIKGKIKKGGWIEIRTPDLRAVCKRYLTKTHIYEPLYVTSGGLKITTIDVLYGYQPQVLNGNPYFAHKILFDLDSLAHVMHTAGFTGLLDFSKEENLELHVIGYV